ncbi:MAG: hypothetical protein [Caudoviricetes sp.]|nr:MAG: hypothetical protein [Caudoviricetes sp.]
MITSMIQNKIHKHLVTTGRNANTLLLSNDMFIRLTDEYKGIPLTYASLNAISCGHRSYAGMRVLTVSNAVDMVEVTYLESSHAG